jgi:PAS domain S-box-containing protein
MSAFLDGGGDCGALIKSLNWSDSLGPVDDWPQSLKAATGLLLRSPVPMVMLWGEDGIMLYNDAYSVFAGQRHPMLLGSRVREGWPEVAEFNDHVMKVGLSGDTLSFRDQELVLYRSGKAEKVAMNLDYSPVLGDDGAPAGVLAIVIETTSRMAAERELRERNGRLTFFDSLSEAIKSLTTPAEIMGTTARLLGEHMRASVVAYADMEPDQDQFTIRGDWAAPGSTSIVGRYRLAAFGPKAVASLRAGQGFITRDTLAELGPDEGKALLDLGLGATVCMPYVKCGRLTALMAVHQQQPRGWTEGDLSLIAEATERSWAHVVRVRSEAIIRESEDRFRNIADHTPVMLWVTDETGYCTYLNRSWYDFTGQEAGKGQGFGWLDAVHADDRPEAERIFLRANDEHRSFEIDMRVRRNDGSYRWCIDRAAPRFDADGRFLGYVGSVLDVDERREALDKIRRSEEQLRDLIEQMPIGVAVARMPGGEIFLYNHALETILGHPILSDQKDSYDRYGGIDEAGRPVPLEAYPLFRAVAFHETVVGDEMRYRRPDGRIITLLGHAAPIVSGNEQADIAVVTLQDITPRKSAEAHQKLLINELSHRAKNLLAIIQSIAQQSFKGEAAAGEALSRFEGRLGALSAAHGILTQERWEAVPLRRLICETDTAVRSDDERLTVDGPDIDLPPKVAVSLAMAVHELATNAIKYGSLSNDEGKVRISWATSDGRLQLRWEEQGGPPVAQPSRRGFGSRMVERGLAAELGGAVTIHFAPTGLVCDVDAPLPVHG